MKRLVIICFIAISGLVACKNSTYDSVGVRTSALDSSTWEKSKWISAADAPVVSGTVDGYRPSADGASWFVVRVLNEAPVVSAKWMTTGLGVYELFLNGVPVGEEFLKPGFTHHAKTRRSFTYDITDAFCKEARAENILSAQVTPGWWADKIITPAGHEGMVGERCAFRGVLELTYADGKVTYFGTDTENWRAGIAGPVRHASIFDGETFDARELPGYETPEKLSVPVVNTEFQGEILPSEGAEIYLRKDLTLNPVKSYIWEGVTGADEPKAHGSVLVKREFKPGEHIDLHPGETLVVDFGQNCAAVPFFSFKADEGVHLSCLPGEILNDGGGAESRGMDGPEGSVHRRNLRIADEGIRLDYIFAGEGEFVDYHPRCTFFGYRYISLTATGKVTFKAIRSIPVTSISTDMESGSLTTGDESINRLISNTLWGMRSNYLSVPTDCPQRDERLGWTADTQVFAETGTFFARTDRFFHKWMHDMRDTQSETGAFPGVAPDAQYGALPTDMMRFGWADAGIIVPWTVWKQFGDTEIVNENWEAMTRFLDHVAETRYDHLLLTAENGNYQWADWLSYETLESNSGKAYDISWKPLPESIGYWNYLSGCYWLTDARMMRDMAAATGRDTMPFDAMVDEARNYLQRTYLNDDGSFRQEILNSMQTPALFALKCSLVEGIAKENLISRLRQNFADHGDCLQTGFLGTSILMQTLTENGMADLAYTLLFQRKNPSWLYSVDNGATTIWERWNSYTLESGMGPNGMNSFNHYAYGCVCQWLWETAAGIAADPATPGFKHILMKPVPDKRLGHLDAVYRSAAGEIRSSWKYEGNAWSWTFTVPEGATASVTLPGEKEEKQYAAGTYTLVKQ